MKAFRFSLDRALHIRRAQLEIERSKLQKLIHHREQLELQTVEILSEAADARTLIAARPLHQPNEISTVPDYQRGAKQSLLKLDRQKQELLRLTQTQRLQTTDAERKVKLLEKLREQRFTEWNSLMQKEQENFAADAYLARWSLS